MPWFSRRKITCFYRNKLSRTPLASCASRLRGQLAFIIDIFLMILIRKASVNFPNREFTQYLAFKAISLLKILPFRFDDDDDWFALYWLCARLIGADGLRHIVIVVTPIPACMVKGHDFSVLLARIALRLPGFPDDALASWVSFHFRFRYMLRRFSAF